MRLQFLQVALISLPLIIQPWLARHLEPFAYGRFVFATATAAYLLLLCDFGFGWSATRLIAQNRDNAQRLSQIVCETLAAKLVLFGIGFLILLLLVATVREFRSDSILLIVAYSGVFGSVLSSSWYFQGTERPHVGLAADVLGRAVAIPLVVLGVRDPGDLLFATGSLAAGQLLGGLFGFVLLARAANISWMVPNAGEIMVRLRSGVPLFLSTSAVSIYTAASSIVLGFLSTREEVGLFGAAQRVVGACSAAVNPFNQVFYPRIAHELGRNTREATRLMRLALSIQAGLGIVMSAGLFLFSDEIALLLFGPSFQGVSLCLQVMALVPLLLAVGSVFSNLVMLTSGRDALHLTMTIAAALVSLAFLAVLAPKYGSVGGSIALLAAETFVAVFAIVVGASMLRRLEAR